MPHPLRADLTVARAADEEVATLYQALSGCAAQIRSSVLFPFPNPMGLPAP